MLYLSVDSMGWVIHVLVTVALKLMMPRHHFCSYLTFPNNTRRIKGPGGVGTVDT